VDGIEKKKQFRKGILQEGDGLQSEQIMLAKQIKKTIPSCEKKSESTWIESITQYHYL
jgi:hypothetical protein